MNQVLKNWLDKKEPLEVFDISDLKERYLQEFLKFESELIASNKITKLNECLYAIPKTSRFGILMPSDQNFVEYFLKINPHSYIGSMNAFNSLGLSSQVPSVTYIINNKFNGDWSFKHIRIVFIKTSIHINPKYRKLYPILDALDPAVKHLLHDMDSEEQLIAVLRNKVNNLSMVEKMILKRISMQYPEKAQNFVNNCLSC